MDNAIPVQSAYKSRRGSLITAGVLEIIIGVFCLLFAALTVLSMFISSKTGEAVAGPSADAAIAGGLFYLGAAIFFTWLGIGSVMCKRWARALMLVVSWIWLIMGLVGLAFWLVNLPRFAESMCLHGEPPPSSVMTIITVVSTVFMSLFYVVLPFIFLLLYRGENVRLTCEALDPHPRWTDRSPLPVLAVSVLLVQGAVGFVTAIGYAAIPLCGIMVKGPTAVCAILLLTAISTWLAVEIYRLKTAAWWTTAAFTVLGMVNAVLTFGRVTLEDWYAAAGFAEEQIQVMQAYGWSETTLMWWMMGASAVFLAYLVYVKRYFKQTQAAPAL
jgi:hypothetical protein